MYQHVWCFSKKNQHFFFFYQGEKLCQLKDSLLPLMAKQPWQQTWQAEGGFVSPSWFRIWAVINGVCYQCTINGLVGCVWSDPISTMLREGFRYILTAEAWICLDSEVCLKAFFCVCLCVGVIWDTIWGVMRQTNCKAMYVCICKCVQAWGFYKEEWVVGRWKSESLCR